MSVAKANYFTTTLASEQKVDVFYRKVYVLANDNIAIGKYSDQRFFMKNQSHDPKPSNKELVKVIKKRKPTKPCPDEKPTIILPDKKPENN